MDEAEVINDQAERNKAWAEIDKSLTEDAVAIPWLWDKQPMLLSTDVNGVVNESIATWDLTFTSLK